MNLQEASNKYICSFQSLSNQKLLEAFNYEVNQKGWTGTRGAYLAALHQKLNERNIDYSPIGNKKSLSFNKKVVLRNNTIYPISDTSLLPDCLQEEEIPIKLYDPSFSIDDHTTEQIIHFPFPSSYIIPCHNRKEVFELLIWEELKKGPKKVIVFPSKNDGQYTTVVAGIILHINTPQTI